MQTITINKPNHLLHEVTTEIVSIAPKGDRPVKINHFGEYFLTREEAGLVEKGKQKPLNAMEFNDGMDRILKPLETRTQKENVTVSEDKKSLPVKEKRAYKKREVKEVKPVKEKRKYTKKAKS